MNDQHDFHEIAIDIDWHTVHSGDYTMDLLG